jgi:hypothetical protein
MRLCACGPLLQEPVQVLLKLSTHPPHPLLVLETLGHNEAAALNLFRWQTNVLGAAGGAYSRLAAALDALKSKGGTLGHLGHWYLKGVRGLDTLARVRRLRPILKRGRE